MAVAFNRGYTLGRGDLDIFLQDQQGFATDAAEISYAIYDFTTGVEVLVGPAARVPLNPQVGEYYANCIVPDNATVGLYRIRWTFRETVNGPEHQVVQEFEIISDGQVAQAPWSPIQAECLNKLRILLRDNNPDRNYHFRPPTGEESINAFNRVFGYIWEDYELLTYLDFALDFWNASPPYTGDMYPTLERLIQIRPAYKAAVLMGAIAQAAMALSFNWVADEFDYSIGGISLSIEKSSKYESLKQNAEGQFDKQLESKVRTEKYVKGLKQPRYGVGVRSAFGPHVGAGVLTPRKFVS